MDVLCSSPPTRTTTPTTTRPPRQRHRQPHRQPHRQQHRQPHTRTYTYTHHAKPPVYARRPRARETRHRVGQDAPWCNRASTVHVEHGIPTTGTRSASTHRAHPPQAGPHKETRLSALSLSLSLSISISLSSLSRLSSLVPSPPCHSVSRALLGSPPCDWLPGSHHGGFLVAIRPTRRELVALE